MSASNRSPRQPVGRDVPDLADQVGIGSDRPAAPPELLPERLVVDLLRDVEPPAVDAEAQPVLGDAQQVLAHRGVVGVELGQGRQAPPRLVAERARTRGVAGTAGTAIERRGPASSALLVEVEPVAIGRVGAGLEDVVERPEAAAGVVEDAVEDDPHPAAVRLVEQLAQRVVAAEQRVDPK